MASDRLLVGRALLRPSPAAGGGRRLGQCPPVCPGPGLSPGFRPLVSARQRHGRVPRRARRLRRVAALPPDRSRLPAGRLRPGAGPQPDLAASPRTVGSVRAPGRSGLHSRSGSADVRRLGTGGPGASALRDGHGTDRLRDPGAGSLSPVPSRCLGHRTGDVVAGPARGERSPDRRRSSGLQERARPSLVGPRRWRLPRPPGPGHGPCAERPPGHRRPLHLPPGRRPGLVCGCGLREGGGALACGGRHRSGVGRRPGRHLGVADRLLEGLGHAVDARVGAGRTERRGLLQPRARPRGGRRPRGGGAPPARDPAPGARTRARPRTPGFAGGPSPGAGGRRASRRRPARRCGGPAGPGDREGAGPHASPREPRHGPGRAGALRRSAARSRGGPGPRQRRGRSGQRPRVLPAADRSIGRSLAVRGGDGGPPSRRAAGVRRPRYDSRRGRALRAGGRVRSARSGRRPAPRQDAIWRRPSSPRRPATNEKAPGDSARGLGAA